jgi:Transposase DDE domain
MTSRAGVSDMIMQEALPRIKTFFSKIGVDMFIFEMMVRLMAGFIEHTGRMSASQAGGAIRTRAVHRAAITRFLAKEDWGHNWCLLTQLAELLLQQEERSGGTWTFIIDQTHCSQQGDKTENTYSTGNRQRRPRKGRRHSKYKHTRKRCHCFMMGLLITPSGLRIPCCRSYHTKDYAKAEKRVYRTQTQLGADLIRELWTPPRARVVVLGDTAFDAECIREACAERQFHWIVPANPERVLAGEKPRPRVKSLGLELHAQQMKAVRLQPSKGQGKAQRRLSRSRLGPKVKGRTFYVHEEKRDVHSVGNVLLVFSMKELPKAKEAVPVQKILMTNAVGFTAREVVELYDLRWQIELFFKELKSTLGLHQYRFRKFVQVENWVEACLITFVYLEWYRALKLRRRSPSKYNPKWWDSQRTYGICQAIRQRAEAYDLEKMEKFSRTKGGRKKLRKILRAARPLEYRAHA